MIFRQAVHRAAGMADNPDKLSNLIGSVTEKLSDMDERKKFFGEFLFKIRTLIRMLRAYVNGTYRHIPWKSLLLIIGGLLYFLMPLDVIPDFIPATGLTDDITVIFLIFRTINTDIEDFYAFESQSRSVEINEKDEFHT